MTASQYLEIERKAETRSEYFDGQMYARADGSYSHAALIANCTVELGTRLRRTGCRAVVSDLKVRTGLEGFYSYPDLSVVCGEPQFADNTRDVRGREAMARFSNIDCEITLADVGVE